MSVRAQAFNEWMRRYIEESERFEREFQTVTQFLADVANGVPPSYGEACEVYLASIEAELGG